MASMNPKEKVAEVVTKSKDWAKRAAIVLHARNLVVGQVIGAYSGIEGDRFSPTGILGARELDCPVVCFADGHTCIVDEQSAFQFHELTREQEAFYRSMQDGVAGLVRVGAQALRKSGADVDTGIALIEAAIRAQLRALRPSA